jgi:hypothetical protein
MKRFALLLFSLFFLAADTFARAGGGGGGGGGGFGGGGFGGYHGGTYGSGKSSPYVLPILLGFIGGVVVMILVIVIMRAWSTRRLLRQAQKEDPAWNVKLMKQHALDVFHRMQDAWKGQDMNAVKDILMTPLFRQYNLLLSRQKQRGMRNVLDQITITKARIVNVQDSDNNSEDRFSIYIAGEMIDYMEIHRDGMVYKSGYTEVDNFEDTYHFHRQGNIWLLENIDNAPDRFEKLTASFMNDNIE